MSEPAGSSDTALKRRKRHEGRQGGVPDGRLCQVCGEADTSDDPIDTALLDQTTPRSWGYEAAPNGAQQGKTCYYCMQVYQSKFRVKGMGLSSALAQLGQDANTMEKFMRYVRALIAFLIDKGGRSVTVSWAQVQTRVVSMETESKVELQEADDQLWCYEYYVKMKGDPRTNGLGHTETTQYGKREVRVPTAPIRTMKRSSAQVVRTERCMSTGEGDFHEGQQDDLLAELAAVIDLPRANGLQKRHVNPDPHTTCTGCCPFTRSFLPKIPFYC